MSAPKLEALFPWVSPSRQRRAHPGDNSEIRQVEMPFRGA